MDLIVTHTGGDFDSLASLVAAKKLYPHAKLLFPGSPERSVREFISLCKDLVRIETERDINLEDVTRLVIVDTRLKGRIGKAAGLIGRRGVEVHIYDHHPKTPLDIKAEGGVSKPTGATVTILIDLIRKKNIKITPLEATIMALGIYEDTGSLTFRTTTKEDVDTVSFLMTKGADLAVVSSYLSRELSDNEISALINLIQSTEVILINGIKIAISAIKSSEYVGDLSVLVHKLIDIENLNVLFVMSEAESKVHVVARSRLASVNVDKIMRRFGGGGHLTAASAVLKKATIDEVKKRMIKALKEDIKPAITAGDIMSSPVKTVTPQHIISEVKKTMMRYGLGGMPVIQKAKVVGIITRSDADKAIYHGFGHSRVKGYMSTNPITAETKTPVYELQRIIFENDIGRLPILKKGKLIGIVTRTDLLRTVHEELMDSVKKNRSREFDLKDFLSQEDTYSLLKKSLSAEIFKILKTISAVASSGNFSVYLVGGFVRDLLLGVKNYDIDIVVEGNGLDFAKRLAKSLKAKVLIHARFQTAILILKQPAVFGENVLKIDIATARSEYYEFPAALPKVELSSLKKDLYRRDFTINAMAISLNESDFGLLVDFFGGRRDLSLGKIKVLHNLSFVEDPTRIFRALRFEQRYNFKIDSQTEHLIKTAVSLDMFKKVAGERLREEIIYILKEDNPLGAVKRMSVLHELRFIHPKIKWSGTLEAVMRKIKPEMAWFEDNVKRSVECWLIYFMAMLINISYKEADDVAKRFALTNADKYKILSFKKSFKNVIKTLKNKKLRPSEVYKVLKNKSPEEIVLISVLSKSKLVRRHIECFFKLYSKVKPALKGEDLKRIGLKPSPDFGKVLDKLLEEKIDGKLKTKKDEIDFVRKFLKLKE